MTGSKGGNEVIRTRDQKSQQTKHNRGGGGKVSPSTWEDLNAEMRGMLVRAVLKPKNNRGQREKEVPGELLPQKVTPEKNDNCITRVTGGPSAVRVRRNLETVCLRRGQLNPFCCDLLGSAHGTKR